MYTTTEITSDTIASDNPIHQQLLFPYVAAAQTVTGKVLELGCGWGRGVELLANASEYYTGIDKNRKLMTVLNTRYTNVKFIAATLPAIHYLANNTYDYIVSFQVIEHIENDALFLQEAYRVLKPGGRIFITTINKEFSLTRNLWHIREYSADSLHSVMAKHFSIVEACGVSGNDKVMHYREKNKAMVKKITQFDIFNFQYCLPRRWLQLPYEMMNCVCRNALLKATNTAAHIHHSDFHLTAVS